MLVSRFLLDLQEAHQRKVVLLGTSSLLDSPSSPSSWVAFGSPHTPIHLGSQGASGTNGTLVFAPAGGLGALGASIDPEDWSGDAEGLDDEYEEEGAGGVVLAFPAPRRDGGSDSVPLEDVDGESPPPSPPWTEYKALLGGRRVG